MPNPKKLRLAINGFGRIGRTAYKIASRQKRFDIVAVNDLSDAESLAHLLAHDSIYGRFGKNVGHTKKSITVDGRTTEVFCEKDPARLPWKRLKVDVVLECTGRFVKDGAASVHLQAGAKSVILSAPAKGTGDVPTAIIGVKKAGHKSRIVSNASCTTNNVVPVTRVMLEHFGVLKAMMTTIHSYTAEQNLVDAPPPPLHKDLRRARSAAINLVPTTSGAAISTTEIFPELKGSFDGYAIRVPTPIVSLSDITFLVKKKTTIEQVNRAFRKAAADPTYRNVLAVSEAECVSTDFIGDPHSAIVDLLLTNVVGGDLVKIVAWYDNEWGYSNRLVELAAEVGSKVSLRKGVTQ